ncbi:MAG: TonB-dependent receptor family protein [Candidatus Methylacidiphilaceae bacterium]
MKATCEAEGHKITVGSRCAIWKERFLRSHPSFHRRIKKDRFYWIVLTVSSLIATPILHAGVSALEPASLSASDSNGASAGSSSGNPPTGIPALAHPPATEGPGTAASTNVPATVTKRSGKGDTTDLAALQLGETTVTSTEDPSLTMPSAQAMEKMLNELPASSNMIKSEKVRQGRAATLQDIFRYQPGLWVMPGFTGPNATRFNIRGSGLSSGAGTTEGVYFMQDGIPLMSPDGTIFNMGQFDPLAYSYTTVYRGAEAMDYGFATLFGAVNFTSFTGYTAPAYSTYFQAGSFGYLQGSASAAGVKGKNDYFAVLTEQAGQGYRFQNSFNNITLNTNFGHRFSDHLENRVFFTYSDQQWQVPGPLTLDQAVTTPTLANPTYLADDYRQFWSTLRLADKLSYVLDGDQKIDVGLSWTNMHQLTFYGLFFSSSNNFFSLPLRYQNTQELFGLRNLFVAGALPQGADYTENWNQLKGPLEGAPMAVYNMTVVNVPIYAYDQLFLTDKLSVNVGLTFQDMNYTNEAYKYATDKFPAVQPTTSLNYSQFNPKLGLTYQVVPEAMIYTSVARSFQPPTLYQTAVSPTANYFSRNLGLLPLLSQSAITAEIGSRGSAGRFSWNVDFFNSWVNRELLEITPNPLVPTVVETINASPTTMRGVEVLLNTILFKDIMVPGTSAEEGDQIVLVQSFDWYRFDFASSTPASFVGTNGRTTFVDLKGNQLFGIPEFFYQAQLLYHHPSGFYIGPNVMAFSTYPVDLVNSSFVPGTALLGAQVGYQSKKGLNIFFQGMNLTNDHFVSMVTPQFHALPTGEYFWPGDGFAVYGGISWNF